MSKITETTLLPISLVIALAGGIFWLSTMYAETKENTKAIASVEEKSDSYLKYLVDIDRRLAVIEGELKVQRRNTK